MKCSLMFYIGTGTNMYVTINEKDTSVTLSYSGILFTSQDKSNFFKQMSKIILDEFVINHPMFQGDPDWDTLNKKLSQIYGIMCREDERDKILEQVGDISIFHKNKSIIDMLSSHIKIPIGVLKNDTTIKWTLKTLYIQQLSYEDLIMVSDRIDDEIIKQYCFFNFTSEQNKQLVLLKNLL